METNKVVMGADVDADAPPEFFVCPISRDIMRDPVVLVETGQIYDRPPLMKWFKTGRQTCPLSGSRVATQSTAPLHSLRGAIREWALSRGIELPGSINASTDAFLASSLCPQILFQRYGPINDAGHCLKLMKSKGVSGYDVAELFSLVEQQSMPMSYAALVLLREIAAHSHTLGIKCLKKAVEVSVLKGLLDDPHLQVPAARLLVDLGVSLTMPENLVLLGINDQYVRAHVLSSVMSYVRSIKKRAMKIAEAALELGAESCVQCALSILVSDGTGVMGDATPQMRDGAALILACLGIHEKTRLVLESTAIPAMIRHVRRTTTTSVRNLLAKAIQYLCETSTGLRIAQANSAVDMFYNMLPSVNRFVKMSDFVYSDLFAFNTVADTAVKGLYRLSVHPEALVEMLDCNVSRALHKTMLMPQTTDRFRAKYAKALLKVLWREQNARSSQVAPNS